MLRAIGVDEELAHTSIRFGIGRFTTKEEVDFAVDLCVKHVNRLREMSPLWEMVQEGIDLKSIQWSRRALMQNQRHESNTWMATARAIGAKLLACVFRNVFV